MKYEKLKDEIREIAKIAAAVPETFRVKCFEILLNDLLSEQLDHAPPPPSPPKPGETPTPPQGSFKMPSQVLAFMRRKELKQEQIEAIVMLDGDELHFIKEPSHGQVSKGQIEWALLIALKNGILNNSLKADPEDVRSIVQEKGYYDSANFSTNFKNRKNASLFRNVLEGQGDAQALSTEGETALANLVNALSGIN